MIVMVAEDSRTELYSERVVGRATMVHQFKRFFMLFEAKRINMHAGERLFAILLLVTSVAPIPVSAQAGGATSSAVEAPKRTPDVGFAPTTHAAVEAMLKLAGVGPQDVVYDLGSGDGRIVILAAQKYGASGVGIDLDPVLVNAARRAARQAGVNDQVTFIEGDLFTTDISPATVVTLYLWPSVNRRLEAKLRNELRPGTRIVSNAFGIGNWLPEQTVHVADGTELMLWTVPRRPSRTPDVPFVPTPEPVVDELLRLASVDPTDTVYDLGSGDGRVLMLAALKYGARGVGIELDPRLVELSQQVAREADALDKVTFIETDLFTADISQATVVTLSLSADVNARLEPKLRELKPGTRIVSRQFPIGTWRPDKTIRASNGDTLVLWVVPQPR